MRLVGLLEIYNDAKVTTENKVIPKTIRQIVKPLIVYYN